MSITVDDARAIATILTPIVVGLVAYIQARQTKKLDTIHYLVNSNLAAVQKDVVDLKVMVHERDKTIAGIVTEETDAKPTLTSEIIASNPPKPFIPNTPIPLPKPPDTK